MAQLITILSCIGRNGFKFTVIYIQYCTDLQQNDMNTYETCVFIEVAATSITSFVSDGKTVPFVSDGKTVPRAQVLT